MFSVILVEESNSPVVVSPSFSADPVTVKPEPLSSHTHDPGGGDHGDTIRGNHDSISAELNHFR